MIQAISQLDMNTILTECQAHVSPPFQSMFKEEIKSLFDPHSWMNNPTLCLPMKRAIQNIVQNLLVGAVQTHNMPFIWMLKQRGADCNEVNEEEKQTPLGAAVLARDPRVISFIIDHCGANPNGEDEEGRTALDIAIQLRDPRLVHVLHEKGAHIDHVHTSGQTSLTKAVTDSDMDRIQLLKRFGADLDCPDADGLTPLALACCEQKKNIARELLLMGADSALAHEIILVKTLSAIWGLGSQVYLRDRLGKQRSIPLEGFCTTFTHPFFLREVERFFSRHAAHEKLLPKEKEAILRTWKSCCNMDTLSTPELFCRIKTQNPFITIQSFSEHVIGILISKNAIMICNRGHDDESRNGVEIYSLNTSQLTDSMVEQLQEIESMSDQSEWLDMLKESSLKMQYCDLIEQKPQQVGNCTWASLESLFLALIYTTLEERIKEEKERKTLAYEIYKQFTASARIRMLDFYLRFSTQPIKDLLEAILEKIDFKHFIPSEERARLSSRMREMCEKLS